MKIMKCCRLFIVLCLLLWAPSAFTAEKIVKYPPMTAGQVQTIIGEAALWLEKMIKEGKEKEAFKILSQAPRFKLSNQAWKQLNSVLNSKVIEAILPLKDREFAEGKDLIPMLREGKISNYWDAVKTVLQHADEVFSTRWNKGSLMDYRFVISYNCKNLLHVTHAMLPQITKVKLNAIKSVNGKYYGWEMCNKLSSGAANSWWIHAPTVNPFKLPQNMYFYMKQVNGTSYQVGTVVRHINQSENELNQNFR